MEISDTMKLNIILQIKHNKFNAMLINIQFSWEKQHNHCQVNALSDPIFNLL